MSEYQTSSKRLLKNLGADTVLNFHGLNYIFMKFF